MWGLTADLLGLTFQGDFEMSGFFRFEHDGERRYHIIGKDDELCYGYFVLGPLWWVYINEHAQAFPDAVKLEEILSFMKGLAAP